jgi:hypothetical protein
MGIRSNSLLGIRLRRACVSAVRNDYSHSDELAIDSVIGVTQPFLLAMQEPGQHAFVPIVRKRLLGTRDVSFLVP